jgi:DNA-binding transcriptional MocR family regulator
MVTTGALGAIGLILSTFVEPGDRVLVEQPTFPGALAAISAAGARPVPVAVAPDAGWDLSAVHIAIRQLVPQLAYLIPDVHNPSGLTGKWPKVTRRATASGGACGAGVTLRNCVFG